MSFINVMLQEPFEEILRLLKKEFDSEESFSLTYVNFPEDKGSLWTHDGPKDLVKTVHYSVYGPKDLAAESNLAEAGMKYIFAKVLVVASVASLCVHLESGAGIADFIVKPNHNVSDGPLYFHHYGRSYSKSATALTKEDFDSFLGMNLGLIQLSQKQHLECHNKNVDLMYG